MNVARNMTRLLKGLRRSDRGGAMVELAVILPVLVLLVVGVVDYGRAFYTSVTVANAARAGAEWGAQSPEFQLDFAGMENFGKQDGQDAAPLDLTATRYCECAGASWPSCTACAGGAAPDVFIEVTASKDLTLLLPYPGLPNTVSIARKATFRSQ